MTDSGYRHGDVVDITIKGAVVDEVCHHGFEDGHELKFKYAVPSGDMFGMAVIYDAPGVTIERREPAEWPPQKGDLWRDADGDLWFATLYVGELGLTFSGTERRSADKLIRNYGPLTLVHREGGEQA